MRVPYIFPVENGGREDVRWARFTNEQGIGLQITIQEISAAQHTCDLKPREEIIVHIDGWHMGIGGDDSLRKLSTFKVG